MPISPEVLPAADFQTDFASEVRRAKRYSEVLAYLECETQVEHAAELAEVLRNGLRESDLVGDLGGGRFGVVLIAADVDASGLVAGRLAAAAEKAGFVLRARRSIFPFDGLDPAALTSAIVPFE